MTHLVEPAASGRSKCRGCNTSIAKSHYRFGEVLPNPFADGDMTVWFHLDCALLRRPEAFVEVDVPEVAKAEMQYGDKIHQVLKLGQDYRRLQRLCGIERAPSSRAKCRHCRDPITKDDWRIQISFFEESTFNSGGNIHLTCALDYFETADFELFLKHFAPDDLSESDWREIREATQSP